MSFFRNKAKNIKKTATIIQEKYSGEVPDTYKELISLPGIGPKSALSILSFVRATQGFNKSVGINVDSNMQRVVNRLGWVSSSSVEMTRRQLEAFVPEKYWGEMNLKFVDFGQNVCLLQRPKCGDCLLLDVCPFGAEQAKLPEKRRSQGKVARDKKGLKVLDKTF